MVKEGLDRVEVLDSGRMREEMGVGMQRVNFSLSAYLEGLKENISLWIVRLIQITHSTCAGCAGLEQTIEIGKR